MEKTTKIARPHALRSIGAPGPKITHPDTPGPAPSSRIMAPVPTHPAVPVPPPAAAPPEPAVHLATAWDEPTQKNIAAAIRTFGFRPFSIAGEGLALALNVLVLIAFVSPAAGLPGGFAGPLFLLLLVILLAVLVFRLVLARSDSSTIPEFPRASDPTSRIRAVALARDLRAFRAAPLDLSAPFEPVVARITYALEPRAVRNAKVIALPIAGISIMALVDLMFAPSSNSASSLWFFCGLGVAHFSRPFLWPTYLRVVPGRLDILQYRFLGIGRPRVRSTDLRHARVAIRLGSCFAVFPHAASTTDTPDTGELLPLPETIFGARRHAFAFERALASAALTRFPAPSLPKDELIG